MKRKIQLTIVILCGLMAVYTQAQMTINIVNTNEVINSEPIDKAQFTIQYEMTSLYDTLKPESRQEETMMLKIGKNVAQFYSFSKYMVDSLVADAKANGSSQEVIIDIIQKYIPKVTYQIYKDYPSGKVTTLDRLAMSNFKCEEVNEKPEWKILPDTMTLLTYPCQKAVCQFKGRDYEAWFTTEIPRSEGPWKLNGLPGLILKAKDSREHYTFEATALIQNHSEDIMYPGKGYEPISRKDLNKVYERYFADPVGFVTSMAPNVSIKMQGEDGQPMKNPKNIPYNPIELK